MNSKGLSLKFCVSLFTVFIALTCYLPTIVIYYYDTQDIYEENLTRLKNLAIEMSQGTLSFALASNDIESMENILSGIAENPLVYRATLYSNDGQPIVQSVNDNYSDLQRVTLSYTKLDIVSEKRFTSVIHDTHDLTFTTTFDEIKQPDNERKETVVEGTLELQLTRHIYDEEFYERVLKTAAISAAIWLLLLFAMLKLSSKLVKYMNNMLKASARLAEGDFSRELKLDSRIREMQDFAVHYNILLAEIKSATEEKEEITRKTDEANKFKQQFLQMAAHQIRTPIASIIGLLDLTLQILGSNVNPVVSKNLEMSAACAEELEQQLVTIMNLSAIEDGTLTPIYTWFKLNEPANSANRIFMMKAIQKKLRWHCNINETDAPIEIHTDKNIVKEIVKIITDNAIKYTDKGFVRFEYGYLDRCLWFTVEDSGIGMTASEINTLMTNPRQLEQGTTRTREGWGFGMMLLHRYVKLLDGSLTINSTPNLGTKFKIEIPAESKSSEILIHNDAQVSIESSNSSDIHLLENSHKNIKFKSSNIETPISKRLKILIVEDNPTYSLLTKQLLECEYMSPYRVIVDTVDNGSDGLTYCREESYDIIFVDYHMGNMNGVQFVENLKAQNGPCSHSKLIGMTADTSLAGHAYSELEKLTSFVLIKPLDRMEIRNILKGSWLKAV